jgi:hypothetical protein
MPRPRIRRAAAVAALAATPTLFAQTDPTPTIPGERIDDALIAVEGVRTPEMIERASAIHEVGPHIGLRLWNSDQGVWAVAKVRGRLDDADGNYIINTWGDPRMGIDFGAPIDVVSLDLLAHGAATPGVTVVGFRDGVEIARSARLAGLDETPTTFRIDLAGVDRIEVLADPADNANGGGFYGLDNLTLRIDGQIDTLDFEDLTPGDQLTGSDYAGIAWENGAGDLEPAFEDGPGVIPAPVLMDLGDDDAEDPRVQASRGLGTSPSLVRQFAGTRLFDSFANAIPPDTHGSVGPDHYVIVTNTAYNVYSKASGLRIQQRSLGSISPGTSGDPRVLYDQYADRWVVVSTNFNNRIYMAVSTTNDPTGSFFAFNWLASTGSDSGCFPDYPTLGLDDDGYYVGAFMAGCGHTLFAIEKAPLIAGAPSVGAPSVGAITAWRSIAFTTLQPAHTFGSAPGQYVISRNSNTNCRYFLVTGSLASPSLTGPFFVANPSAGPPSDMPQSGGTAFDTLDGRYQNCVYRDGLAYWTSCTNFVGRASVTWFVADLATSTLVDSGVVTDSVLSFNMPSIAVNSRGSHRPRLLRLQQLLLRQHLLLRPHPLRPARRDVQPHPLPRRRRPPQPPRRLRAKPLRRLQLHRHRPRRRQDLLHRPGVRQHLQPLGHPGRRARPPRRPRRLPARLARPTAPPASTPSPPSTSTGTTPRTPRPTSLEIFDDAGLTSPVFGPLEVFTSPTPPSPPARSSTTRPVLLDRHRRERLRHDRPLARRLLRLHHRRPGPRLRRRHHRRRRHRRLRLRRAHRRLRLHARRRQLEPRRRHRPQRRHRRLRLLRARRRLRLHPVANADRQPGRAGPTPTTSPKAAGPARGLFLWAPTPPPARPPTRPLPSAPADPTHGATTLTTNAATAALALLLSATIAAHAQVGVVGHVDKLDRPDKFRQLEEILPTPHLHTHRLRRARARVLAAARRLRHRRHPRRRPAAARRLPTRHLPQPLPRHPPLPLAPARPEHLRQGLRRRPRAGGPRPRRLRRPRHQPLLPRAPTPPLPPLLRRRLRHPTRRGRRRTSARPHHRQDDDAHRPPRAPPPQRELRLRDRLGLQHQRRHRHPRTLRLRVLRGRRQPHLPDRAVVPPPRRLRRQHRLAAQAVPRTRRVHTRARRLHRPHHRARRPRRRRHRRPPEPPRRPHARPARPPRRRRERHRARLRHHPPPRPSPTRTPAPTTPKPGSSAPTTSATSPGPPPGSSSGTPRASTSTATRSSP